MPINNSKERKAARREIAAANLETQSRRTVAERIASLEMRGETDCKEYIRLSYIAMSGDPDAD